MKLAGFRLGDQRYMAIEAGPLDPFNHAWTPVALSGILGFVDAGRYARIRRMDRFTGQVTIDGTSISMLVDTGASTVVLKQADAKKLGIDVAGLTYSVPVQTANGMAYAAPVRLRNLSVGPIVIPQVEALVAQTGTLKESLLGMTFLSRLRSYEFSGDFLTLRS